MDKPDTNLSHSVAQAMSGRERAAEWLNGQNQILEMVARNVALPETLIALARLIEAHIPEGACSILLMDANGKQLRPGAIPSLPESFRQAVDGLLIGPASGSCGTAAYRGAPVISADIATDPLWVDYRDWIITNYGLRASWSSPILATNGKVLGTFALYYRALHTPSEQERELVESSRHLASVAIERKQAEEALAAERNLLRTLIDHLPDIVFAKDRAGHFVLSNAAHRRWLGLAQEEEVIGKTAYDFYAAAQAQRYQADDQTTLATGQPLLDQEHAMRDKAGQLRWHLTTKVPLKDGAGQVIGLVAIVRDITERKQSEEALATEKERLLVTLRSIGDAVIATDAQGMVVLMNPVAEQLTGWTLDAAQAQPLSQVFNIINSETRERYENPVAQVLLTGSMIGLAAHTALVARDGRELLIADSGAPIRDADGQMLGVVLVFRDVSEQHKVEAALQNAAKLEAVGLLAGGIAHDFNNLLSGIFGHIHLAQAASHSPAVVEAHLAQALEAFQRAKSLTQQLLTFATGGAPVKRMASLRKLLRETTQFVLSGSNVRAELRVADDLWLCEMDEGQIAQALDNLLINALQAMPTGGTLRIRAENLLRGETFLPTPSQSHWVRIVIQDQGAGIPKEHLDRVFEPFFTTKHKGSGLGLATAYSIIHRHEGHITVESELGKGATFYIYLPATPDAVMMRTSSAAQPLKGRGHILVMDDEDSIRMVVSKLLERQGYTTAVAGDGAEALELVRQARASAQPFDAAILDLTIPGGLGGKEIALQLLSIAPELKTIVSSGYSDDPVMANPQAYGFKGVIAKPYTPAELSAVLREVLRSQ